MMRESQLGGQTCFFLGGMVLLMLRQQKFHTASPSLNQKNETLQYGGAYIFLGSFVGEYTTFHGVNQ